MQGQWWQWTCILSQEQAEALGGLLMEAGALGVEEKATDDRWILQQYQGEMRLVAYFGDEPDEALLQEVAALAEDFGIDPESAHWSTHRDDGWSTHWKRFFHPLHVTERLVICPSWERFDAQPDQIVIELDPGMAFGTGHHETTRQCMRLLERYLTPQQRILDVGCGSGILAITAIRLGASHAVGIDIDADAIAVAIENAERNGVANACSFSAQPIEAITERFPLLVANIQAHILHPMREDLWQRVEPNGILLLSGLLHDQIPALQEAFLDGGHHFLEHIAEETWSSLALRKLS